MTTAFSLLLVLGPNLAVNTDAPRARLRLRSGSPPTWFVAFARGSRMVKAGIFAAVAS